MSRLRFSVVIPLHKINGFVFDAVLSAVEMVHESFEVIVVANGQDCFRIQSSLKERFANCAKLRIIATEVCGISFALNLGISEALGTYIVRMDADDICFPLRLKLADNFLEVNPRCEVFGSNYELIDGDGNIIRSCQLPSTDVDIRRKMYTSNPLCHPSVIISRRLALKFCGYLTNQRAEDYDLWVRLSLDKSVVFGNLSVCTIQYRCFGIGDARRNPFAYLSMSYSALVAFLTSFDPMWLLGFCLNFGKFAIVFFSKYLRAASR